MQYDHMVKKALITGITGQDGSYLAEFLLEKGYEVHGIIRRSSKISTDRIDHIYQDSHEKGVSLFLHYGDILHASSLIKILQKVQPDEVYHLAAQSHVRTSFDIPEYTLDVSGLGTLRILDAIKTMELDCKFYQAGSSEMFGNQPAPQNESTSFEPCSPYAISKVAAHHLTVNYREAYGIYACNGILFNHESPRRGETFLTRKVTRAVANIKLGKQKELFLGNLDAKRDWGYAKEYVEAMWMMLQQDQPDDYVIATGKTHLVSEFVEAAFAHAGLHWKEHVKIDSRYYRPVEVDELLGDPSNAKQQLGWESKTSFHDLVKIMVDADIQLFAD